VLTRSVLEKKRSYPRTCFIRGVVRPAACLYTVLGLTPIASATSSCVRRQALMSCRRRAANAESGCFMRWICNPAQLGATMRVSSLHREAPAFVPGFSFVKTDCNEVGYLILRGLPPLRFFRMAAILAKYSGPRSAVLDPPFFPIAAASAFRGSANRSARSLDSASAAFRDSRADAMDEWSGTRANDRSA